MRPSTILKSLSFRIPARLSTSPAVTPLPVRSSFDQQITTELDTLQLQRASEFDYTSASWLLHALEASTAAQKITQESLVNVICRDSDRKAIDDYLEDSIELLDACNGLLDKMEIIHKYVESLRVVLHLLEGSFEPNPTALSRARGVLESCKAMERQCGEMGKCRSGLRKMSQKLAHGTSKVGWHESELGEVLSGSRAVALMVCRILGIALSFKTKCGFPTMQPRSTASWSSSLHDLQKKVKEETEKHRRSGFMMLTELRRTVIATRDLRDHMKQNEFGFSSSTSTVEELKRSCGELEEGIKPLEGRVKELYRHLISIRMALLGILSQA